MNAVFLNAFFNIYADCCDYCDILVHKFMINLSHRCSQTLIELARERLGKIKSIKMQFSVMGLGKKMFEICVIEPAWIVAEHD